jgi:hypothetical protein
MSGAAVNTPAEIPRPRIHHLMACAAVAAIQFSLYRAVYPNAFSAASTTTAILTALNGTLTAIALTLGLFSIYWHFKGLPSLTQPGQYLLVGQIVVAVALYGTIAAMALMYGGGIFSKDAGMSNFMAMSWANAAQFAASSMFSAWCAWKVADTRTWRAVFVVRAIGSLISSWFAVAWMFGDLQLENLRLAIYGPWFGRAIVQLVVDTAAGVSDRRRARPRFSTHWGGLVLSIIGDVLSIVSAALYWSMQQ